MLAVFPLNIVVLPDESVALHLFEPRYRELFSDHRNGEEFVILYEDNSKNPDYGTTVCIEQIINEYPDGTVDVIVRGKQSVKITSEISTIEGKMYSGVTVNRIVINNIATDKLITQFRNYFTSMQKSITKPEPFSMYYIANKLQLTTETKNSLIAIENEKSLSSFLINEIRFLSKIREQENTLNQNFQLN
tara:strand:- start:96 stop:665 length:570 start_codon:yes stop_codon:yes gene_type:complete